MRLLNHIKKIQFTIISVLFFIASLQAQTDTEFWFVAPEVTSGHGDSPIVMRISANETAADITLSQPANSSFNPIALTIPAGTTQTIDLTPFQTLIENQPPDQVLNKGILMESDVPVTAYYEVNNGVNPEIFPLKGGNALGTEFYTPFPTNYDNGFYSPPARSGFEIVATADNTEIIINPTADLIGHPAGVPFTITLDRGQTYSLLSNSTAATLRPTGTRITSNKPIAVTLKDDSAALQGCRDLMGDQLVPTGVIGKEYIVMKGFLNSEERVYVLATTNNTEVFVDGSATPNTTLNNGQQFTIDVNNPTVYISCSQPVYVLHVSGFGCEMGSAVLPSIECTGSPSVFFTRSTSEFFGLNIMVRNGAEGSFTLNGSSTLVPASAFTPVNGSSGEWLSAQLSFSEADITIGATSILSNSASTGELFHLGIIHGGAGSGCRYGYFSDFASTYLGDNRVVCVNDSLLLDAGAGKDSYEWSTGETTQSIYVNEPGIYWVLTVKDGCESTDTVDVIEEFPDLGLPENLAGCDVPQVTISPVNGFYDFLWNTGSTLEELTVSQNGVYFVEALSSAGCRARDTVQVNFTDVPPLPNLQFESPVCSGNNLPLISPNAQGTVYWEGPLGFNELGSTIQIEAITVSQSGTYYVSQEADGCRSDSVAFEIDVQQSVNLEFNGDTILCDGELSEISISGFDTLEWNNGSTESTLDIGAGVYTVFSTSEAGCNDTLQITLIDAEPNANFSANPELVVLVDTPLLLSDSSTTPAGTELVEFTWNFEGYPSQTGESIQITFPDTGTVLLTYVVENDEGCRDTITATIQVIDDVIVPNVFSPNGDGKNDVFGIGNIEAFTDANMVIYNRWGKLIYENAAYQNNWTGDEYPDGTYFYVLDIPKLKKIYKGSVTMCR
jgi:gliding motility-associated-like protein